jgi:hypothetical protein
MQHVAGKAVDGSMVTFFDSGNEWPITKVEYADNLTIAKVRELGSQEIVATTNGTYEPEEKTFEMVKARWEEYLLTLPANGFGNTRFPIVVRAEDPDTNILSSLGSQADTLENCRILGVAASYENSEAVSIVVVKYFPQQIRWSQKTLNRVAGVSGVPGL